VVTVAKPVTVVEVVFVFEEPVLRLEVPECPGPVELVPDEEPLLPGWREVGLELPDPEPVPVPPERGVRAAPGVRPER
jgi:hypothetical protein